MLSKEDVCNNFKNYRQCQKYMQKSKLAETKDQPGSSDLDSSKFNNIIDVIYLYYRLI